MAAPKVIVSLISTLSPLPPPQDRRRIRVDIEFQDGSTAWLNPLTPSWSQWAFAFSQLRQYQLPVYIEADPESGAILEYQVPVFGRVARLDSISGGGLRILLDGVFAFFSLRESHPGFAGFAETLRHARKSGSAVILTKKCGPDEIVDITVPDAPPAPVLIRAAAASCVKAPGEIPPVDLKTAAKMFALVNETTCDPADEAIDCIPFLYPIDGCEARAHKMCQLMATQGVTSAKVLNYPEFLESLTVKTPNAPGCSVSWPGHIAPILHVSKGSAPAQTYVIDPSLCNGPVTLAHWVGLQAGSGGQFFVSANCYQPSPDDILGPWCTDPNDQLMDATLVRCRNALTVCHPPYGCP
jgi:hypothetical protein